MKRRLINAALVFFVASSACAAGAKDEVAAWDSLPAPGTAQRAIKIGDMDVSVWVSGVTTAQETYDIFSPFEGRVEEVRTELFGFVTPKSILARMVSTEMAALLDSTTEDSRRQAENRWKDLYKFTDIKARTPGIVTHIYVEPKAKVAKGDRLFTIAKKVVIVAKNTQPLYSRPALGVKVTMEQNRRPTVKFDTVLTGMVPEKDAPQTRRLWLEVLDLKNGIKIGEQFNGLMFVASKKNVMIVPRAHIINSGGKRFLITEIKTGLETDEETEILSRTSIYLEPPPAETENTDGKSQKVR